MARNSRQHNQQLRFRSSDLILRVMRNDEWSLLGELIYVIIDVTRITV